MKKLIITLLTATICTIYSPGAQAREFTDIPISHPNFVAINYLSEVEVLKGYEDGSFQPDKLVNRVEVLKIILVAGNIKLAEEIEEALFTDVRGEQWFSVYVATAKALGIVNGHPDGSFTPAANVKRAAFFKMLLESNRFKKDKWDDQQFFSDVSTDQWYAPYMNYAGKSGLLKADTNNKLHPDQELTRAEVAEILYLMRVILRGKDNQFLLTQAEAQMAQVETYIGIKDIFSAKRATDLAVDMSQKALINLPENNIVLGAAKLARAYQFLVEAFIAGIQQDIDKARTFAEETKVKADEAAEANEETLAIAEHIKERADEILSQL